MLLGLVLVNGAVDVLKGLRGQPVESLAVVSPRDHDTDEDPKGEFRADDSERPPEPRPCASYGDCTILAEE
jgi:hypothetical protein